MSLAVAQPAVLWLMPLALLPLLLGPRARLSFSSLPRLPGDRLSSLAGIGLRLAGVATIALLVLAVSGPFRAAQPVERLGEGAEIVLLLDRSRSMDEPFAGQAFANPLQRRGYESKGTVARRLLAEFAAGRNNDRIGMLVFSTKPIRVTPLTDRQEFIQAAIQAGNVGRGLAKTDIGAGLLEALQFFEGRPYSGSRVVLLISDGGARLDLTMRVRLQNQFRRQRAGLYWIYLRSRNSPGIRADAGQSPSAETAPARALHEYFASLDIPYRAYDAEDPQSLGRAIDDVSRLQSLPIRYVDILPRRDLAALCYGIGLALLALLIAAQLLELREWA